MRGTAPSPPLHPGFRIPPCQLPTVNQSDNISWKIPEKQFSSFKTGAILSKDAIPLESSTRCCERGHIRGTAMTAYRDDGPTLVVIVVHNLLRPVCTLNFTIGTYG